MLGWIVELHPTFRNGVPYDPTGRYQVRDFYVFKGILLEDKEPWRPERKKIKIVWSGKATQIHKIKGIYYEITIKDHEPNYCYIKSHWGKNKIRIETSVLDPIYDFCMTKWDRNKYYGGQYVGTSKRQINKKEIKRLKAALA
jgi:hypothetical protein